MVETEPALKCERQGCQIAKICNETSPLLTCHIHHERRAHRLNACLQCFGSNENYIELQGTNIMAQIKKPMAAALGAAFLATSMAPLASAEVNPFSAQQLSGGYDLANYDKHKEGKCGDDKADKEGKCGEGKCGEGKCGGDKAAKEGKCGEGKCGEGKCGGDKAAKEGKCGEGKCGGDKAAKEGKCGEGKCGGDKAAKEGKCGEGKCGGDKAAKEGSCGDKK
jgi:uncharacterized low-complexity protein